MKISSYLWEMWVKITTKKYWFVDVDEETLVFKNIEQAKKVAFENKTDVFVCWFSKTYGWVYQTELYYSRLKEEFSDDL